MSYNFMARVKTFIWLMLTIDQFSLVQKVRNVLKGLNIIHRVLYCGGTLVPFKLSLWHFEHVLSLLI